MTHLWNASCPSGFGVDAGCHNVPLHPLVIALLAAVVLAAFVGLVLALARERRRHS